MLRGLQREGLWLPRTGLSGVSPYRVRVSTNTSHRQASVNVELSGTNFAADLSGGFCLLRQNHRRAKSGIRIGRRTSWATTELPARYRFPTRSSGKLRPSSATRIRANRNDGKENER